MCILPYYKNGKIMLCIFQHKRKNKTPGLYSREESSDNFCHPEQLHTEPQHSTKSGLGPKRHWLNSDLCKALILVCATGEDDATHREDTADPEKMLQETCSYTERGSTATR